MPHLVLFIAVFLKFVNNMHSKIQRIIPFVKNENNIQLSVLREDLLHPLFGGNKYRKLFYNLKEVRRKGYSKVITFGGAFSNHIAATAAFCKAEGIPCLGIIRGEEVQLKINPTLKFAQNQGMQLQFESRELYKLKSTPEYLEALKIEHNNCYIIPEGGTNALAIRGCTEILGQHTHNFYIIALPVGTGGTIAGVIKASQYHQKIMGFSALKGNFQKEEVIKYTQKQNYEIIDDYCFGGYAKIKLPLIRFINQFKTQTNIPLDPVYTGKMMFGIFDSIQNNKFPKNSRILAIHTGGLQGIAGMNLLLEKKNLPLIN